MVTFFTEATGTPALRPSCEAARFWSRRVMANQRSDGTLGACDLAIRQLVLHGLATVKTRTLGLAASLIAFPCPVKIGPFARIRSAPLMPAYRDQPAPRITPSAPPNASAALTLASIS